MAFFIDAIELMTDLGLFTVVLPFLLVFSIMYAILSKTQMFTGPKKTSDSQDATTLYDLSNLSALISFSVALIVVSATRVISIINTFISYFVLLLILVVMFLIMVGSFQSNKDIAEGKLIDGKWKNFLIGLVLFGIILIFVYSMGWWDWLVNMITGVNREKVKEVIYSIITLIIVFGSIFWIIKDGKTGSSTKN